jgi:hypothetical protein
MAKNRIEDATKRMERAVKLLNEVVTDIRHTPVVTPEGVATVSVCLMAMAMLEHEIGRRLTNSLTSREAS